MTKFNRIIWAMAAILAAGMMTGGCAHKKVPVAKSQLTSPYGRPITIAVAPVMNYSGAQDLDTIKVTDILYSECQQVDGVAVVPVNRMLAQMMRDQIAVLETPQQVHKLASELGADAIVVAAITEYTPFYPPVVGMAVQIYGLDDEPGAAPKFDPVSMERQASPLKVPVDIEPKFWPKNQVQRIYNSRDKTWSHAVKEFAECRGTNDSPYKWELYLHSQEYYLRFVCYKALQELLDKETARLGPGLPPPDSAIAKECN